MSAGTEKEDNIKVFLRVRPLNKKEEEEFPRSCIQTDPNNPSVAILDSVQEQKSFTFDWVYGPVTTQAEVFEKVGLPMVKTCLEGRNRSQQATTAQFSPTDRQVRVKPSQCKGKDSHLSAKTEGCSREYWRPC